MEVMNFWKEILHMCSRRILQGAALVMGCWWWCSWSEYVLCTCWRESRSTREAWHQYCAAADEQDDAKKKGASLKVPHPWQDCKTQHLLWRRSMNWTLLLLLLLHAFPVLTRGSADGPYPSLIGALFLLAALAAFLTLLELNPLVLSTHDKKESQRDLRQKTEAERQSLHKYNCEMLC